MQILFLHTRLSIEGEPLGLMQLTSILKQHGHSVNLVFLNEPYLKICKQIKPDLIVASVMSSDVFLFAAAFTALKATFPELPILIGGPHATFKPACLSELAIDALCVGEGDQAIIDVVDRLQSNSKDFSGIPNIVTRKCQTPPRPLITDLDSLPFIDRELVYGRSKALARFPLRSFYTSRGCPFKCTYCFNHAYNQLYKGLGPIVRKRSVENIIEEMTSVISTYPTSFIKIADDAFIHCVDDWLLHFAKLYKQEINIPFYCLLRADVVTPELVQILKTSGCASVCMSIESGSEEIRKKVLHRNVSNKKITESFDLFNDSGIHIYTNSMLALPGVTIDDDYETLNLNIRCKPSFGNFTIMVPFNGTDIYDYCSKNNFLNTTHYDKEIPNSTGSLSVLNCFTDDEKQIQKNILLLGPLIIKFPQLKNILMKLITCCKPNFIFNLIYFFTKNFLFKKYIVPIRLSLLTTCILAIDQLKALYIQVGKK